MIRNLNGFNKMTKIIQVYKQTANGIGRKFVDENLKLNHMENQIDDKLIKDKEFNPDAIKKASNLLSKGRVIALPTDTIYGIACLVENDESLNRLYQIKKRDINKPIAICVNNLNDVYKWSKVTVKREVLDELLPGQVTVVFERTKLLNENLNPSTNLIGIRIPDHGFVHALTYFNNPIALTSANLSSEASASSVCEFKKLWPNLDAIFDAGKLDERNSSDPSKLGKTFKMI